MAIDTSKNSYTIIFSVVMVVVVGTLLAGITSALSPNSKANKRVEKMQIIMGNAFMRALANKVCPERHQSEGMRIVSGLIEASESLDSAGIMDEGITA